MEEAGPSPEDVAEAEAFNAVLQRDSLESYVSFLQAYPQGRYGDTVRRQLEAFSRTADPGTRKRIERVLDASCPFERLVTFDWPPPEPSARVLIPRPLVTAGLGEAVSVSAVAERLTGALRQADYLQYGFQSIGCNGFALITRLEQIDGSGRPLEGAQRFQPPGQDEPWSLGTYLSRLFYSPPGRYRQIVFAGTDRRFDETRLAPRPNVAELDAMMNAADATTLPEAFDALEWTRGHELHVLIYEFEKGPGDREVTHNRPSALVGEAHVRGAGLYATLASGGSE